MYQATPYVCHKFELRNQIHDRDTKNNEKLDIPKYGTSSGQRSFKHRGTKIWNVLDNQLKSIYWKIKSSLQLNLFVPGCAQWAHPYKYLSVIPEQMIPFACAFMSFNIFPLPSWVRKKISVNSKLSERLPTFVKQGIVAINGKMLVGQCFLAESLPRT